MSRRSRLAESGNALFRLALAVAAGVGAWPAEARASTCLDLADCLAGCADAECQRSCMASADAGTRDLLHALFDCNSARCPAGSPSGCQARECPEELAACRGAGGETAAAEPVRPSRGAGRPPAVMVGMMFPFSFAYAPVIGQASSGEARGPLVGAFLAGIGIGWDGNWLAGPPESAPVFNAGVGLDLGLRYDGGDVDLAPAAVFYFHYFFANDLTDDVWTFFGLGVQFEGGWNDDDGVPFFAPQGALAFRWLGGFTLHLEAFVGPEIWFPNKEADVGVVAGLRLSVGFQVAAPDG